MPIKITASNIQAGKEMQRLRKLAGLRQDEVAKELGLSRVTIANYERGGNRFGKPVWVLFKQLISNLGRISYIKGKRTRRRRRKS